MHTPERVIRSQSTGYSPLDGHTFEDIVASPYTATYLDEITHLHGWFYPGESLPPRPGLPAQGAPDQRRLLLHDQRPRGPGEVRQPTTAAWSWTRATACCRSRSTGTRARSSWCSTTGRRWPASRSIPTRATPIPNNNPNQYHNTIRWAANHPWIRISNLKDILATALASPVGLRHRPRHPLRPRHSDLRVAQARLRELVQLLVLQPECRLHRQRAGLLQPGAGHHRPAGRLPLARRDARQRRTAAAGRHEARRSQHAGHAHVRGLARGGRRAAGTAPRSRRLVLPRHDLRDRVARGGPGRLLRHRLLRQLDRPRRLLGRREHLGAAASEPRARGRALRRGGAVGRGRARTGWSAPPPARSRPISTSTARTNT